MITLGPVGLGILVAGAVSVALYRRKNPNLNLTPGMGAKIGAVSGALGFCVAMIGMAVAVVGFHAAGSLRQAFLDALQQAADRSSSPEAQQALELFKTPEGFTVMLVAGGLMTFLAFLLFAGLGGTLAALLLRRKDRP